MTTSATHNVRTAAKSKILVLGATGGTGRLIVSQALARGHDVTVLVRSPEKLGDAGPRDHPRARRSRADSTAGTFHERMWQRMRRDGCV